VANTFTDRTSTHRSTASLFRRLLRDSVARYKWHLVLAVFCMAIMAGATAYSAFLMETVVNDVFIARDQDILWWVGGIIFATFMAKGIANYGQAMLMSFVGQRIITDSQKKLFVHLCRMDLGFFHNVPTGALISRFTVDLNSMRVAVSNAITSLGKDFFSLVGLVGVMFYQDWELALVAFFVFPASVYPIVRLGRRMRKVVANTQHDMGLFTAILSQTFQGIRVVKAYGMDRYESGRVNQIVEGIFKLNLKAARARSLSSPIMETLGGSAVAVVVIYGGYRVIGDHTDPGSFFSFITALLMAYEPMKRLANLNASLQEGLAGAQRYFDVMDMEPTIQDRPDAKPLQIGDGAINFSGIHFAYNEERTALMGIDIDVPAGKTVALVGPSGAGKSTILNLIPRFYEVDQGSVTIDGQDVRNVTMDSLYDSVALVSQEVTLFDDTIGANIAYGRAGATQAEIEQAAADAAAHDFIQQLPNGYDTVVGEQGVKLSGGQRQRLAIARAMLKNAPILLLDEATSSLDTESERQVQAALDRLMTGRTTVVIAHRLSTIAHADLIYVIDGGKVVEHGRHDDLLQKSGIYAHLYAIQFRSNDDTPSDHAVVATV